MIMAKSWKDHLLSSGLPLEYSVIQELRSREMQFIREYVYERPNELGVATQFSIDIHAQVMKYIWLEFFIECKYRHDSVNWIFTPDKYEALMDEDFHDAFLVFDNLSKSEINQRLLDGYGFRFSVCGKGIELQEKTPNPKSIEQAIHQLQYALSSASASAVRNQIDQFLSDDSPIFVFIPIVIATCNLWRLREETNIAQIREAREIEDVADRKKYLIMKQKPDNRLIMHTHKLFLEKFNEQDRHEYEQLAKGPFRSLKHFAQSFSSNHPSKFFVVKFSEFGSFLDIVLDLFGNPKILKKRKSA